jgi:hypothetical protein
MKDIARNRHYTSTHYLFVALQMEKEALARIRCVTAFDVMVRPASHSGSTLDDAIVIGVVKAVLSVVKVIGVVGSGAE